MHLKYLTITLVILGFTTFTSAYHTRVREHVVAHAPCRDNSTCGNTETCWNGVCRDVCETILCGPKEICLYGQELLGNEWPKQEHHGYCECASGFIRHGLNCVPACAFDSQCGPGQACVMHEKFIRHMCVCLPGFVPDPYYSTICRYRCSDKRQCADDSLCMMGMCLDFSHHNICKRPYSKSLIVGNTFQCIFMPTIHFLYNSTF